MHDENQKVLKLPDRITAKKFLFRTIYCDEINGGAYGFAHDPEYKHISSSAKFWQDRIDAFYSKYRSIAKWHRDLLVAVGSAGSITTPWGRTYPFERKWNAAKQAKVWPKTMIYNYPVQGLGAELMAIVRVSLMRRLNTLHTQAVLVSTVHDSVLIDAPEKEVDKVVELIYNVFNDVPENFKNLFGVEFNLPLRAEVTVGNTLGDMREISKTT